MVKLTIPSLSLLAAILAGCSASVGTFETPADVNDALLKDAETDVAKEFSRKPAAQFPPFIAVARLAGNEERDTARYFYQRNSTGIDALDLSDTPGHQQILDALAKQPGIQGVGALNALIIPRGEPNALKAIRRAAAKIHADMAFIYVVNSGRHVEDQAPLFSFLSLGLAPLQKLDANATLSAALIDVRTGYIYGVISATADKQDRSIGWLSRSESKSLRLESEAEVFSKLVESIPGSWKSVSSRYGANKAPAEVILQPDQTPSASQ